MVSRLAADLLSDKYQLSKYHSKFREIESEENRLAQYVVRDLYAFKEAYILYRIREKQEALKQLPPDNVEGMMELMKEIASLNEIKKVLAKELGERIVLKM